MKLKFTFQAFKASLPIWRDVVSNPGYATCDKTIAEGKGWTVL